MLCILQGQLTAAQRYPHPQSMSGILSASPMGHSAAEGQEKFCSARCSLCEVGPPPREKSSLPQNEWDSLSLPAAQ